MAFFTCKAFIFQKTSVILQRKSVEIHKKTLRNGVFYVKSLHISENIRNFAA